MATVSDVYAQPSFDAVKATFDTNGLNALQQLSAAALAAIALVNAVTWLPESEFTSEELELISPLIGASGTNVLHDKVRKEIETGDYGIDKVAEDLLFERSREREARASFSAIDGANRMYSSGGFTQPTGAAFAVISGLQAEARDKTFSANREQTIKHVDMYLSAKKIVFDAATAIESTNIQAYAATIDKFFKSILAQIDQLKTEIQANATIATAAMSGMNVNLGLSVGANASLGGQESVSESSDKTAGTKRVSDTHSWDETKTQSEGDTESKNTTYSYSDQFSL